MDEMLRAAPELDGMIDVIREQSKFAIKVMELGDAFRERHKQFVGGRSKAFDPVLFVVHNPDFVYDKTFTQWLPDFNDAEQVSDGDEESFEQSEEFDDIDALLDAVSEESDEDIISVFESFEDPKTEPKKKKEPFAKKTDSFTLKDVRDTFTMLFEKGNRYSIYVMVLATTENTVSMIKSGLGASHDFCIYPSLAEMRHEEGATSGVGCAYIIPSGVKTRIIEYTDDDIRRIAKGSER